MKVIILVLISILQLGLCVIPFKYEDKNHSPNKVLEVPSAHVSPDPVVIPGDIQSDIVVRVPRVISGHYKLHVSIHKKVLLWMRIPCILGVGSCEYDFCDLLAAHFAPNKTVRCPQQLVDNQLPCTCPFQPGTYTLPPTTFTIPKLGSLFSWVASGDYHVDASLVEQSTGEEVANYHVEVSAKDAPVHSNHCSGFLCNIFG